MKRFYTIQTVFSNRGQIASLAKCFFEMFFLSFFKQKKQITHRLITLALLLFTSIQLFAYRLTDADVTVINGVITYCTYDISSLGNIIEIPETLQGQTITGLETGFPGKIKEVKFPSTLKTIGEMVFFHYYPKL